MFFREIHSALIFAKAMDGRTIRGFRSTLTCQTYFTFSLVKLDLVGRSLRPNSKTNFSNSVYHEMKTKRTSYLRLIYVIDYFTSILNKNGPGDPFILKWFLESRFVRLICESC